MGMDDVLLGIVLRRLADIPLPEQASDLLLAAFEGDESLSAQLGGQAQPRSKALDVTAPPTPAGAYLQSLTVSGFHGIGAAATLKVMPRPGLTLVVGRNGSGKSSFAEAIEVLLTGDLRRWEKLSAVWKQGWRSMHRPDRAQITAEFLIEGEGRAKAQRTWPVGSQVASSPDWKPAQVDQLRNGGKLAGKPQVNQDQLEMLAGNLQRRRP
jgi:hypothetical protein